MFYYYYYYTASEPGADANKASANKTTKYRALSSFSCCSWDCRHMGPTGHWTATGNQQMHCYSYWGDNRISFPKRECDHLPEHIRHCDCSGKLIFTPAALNYTGCSVSGDTCNISSAYLTGDTIVNLFTDATSQSVPRPHWFVYFCIMTQQNVNGRIPYQNSPTKGTSLGCQLVPKIIPIARNCAI